jgi:hypothetical protein
VHSRRITERLRSALDGQPSDVAYVISEDIECLRRSLQALLKVKLGGPTVRCASRVVANEAEAQPIEAGLKRTRHG